MLEHKLSVLVADSTAFVDSPAVGLENQAQGFITTWPLPEVFQVLTNNAASEEQLRTVSTALTKLFSTSSGRSLLPEALPYAQAALGSPSKSLRVIGVKQLAAYLDFAPWGDGSRQQQVAMALAGMLQDGVTGVAEAAAAGLTSLVRCHPATMSWLLDRGHPLSQELQRLASGDAAVVRQRVLDLLAATAAVCSGRDAVLMRGSVVVEGFLSELEHHRGDVLAACAALATLQQLVEGASPAAALVLHDVLLQRLLPLLDDPTTAATAMGLAGSVVAKAAEAAAAAASSSDMPATANGSGRPTRAANGTHVGPATATAATATAAASGHSTPMDADATALELLTGAAPHPLLCKLSGILDERGSSSSEMELLVVDTTSQLASSAAGAQLLVMAPQQHLLPQLLQLALGRTSGSSELRCAALHALAGVGGVERAGQQRDREAALMGSHAEGRLREAVFAVVAGCVGGVGSGRTPAECCLWLLEQPFLELRVATYRFVSAFALRAWFAAEIANNSSLSSRLCDASSETGQVAAEWRHSATMALQATLVEVCGLNPDQPGAAYQQPLSSIKDMVAAAAAGGPYGASGGRRGVIPQPQVATIP